MAMPNIPGPVPLAENPPLLFRFRVAFFIGGNSPKPQDMMFQKVSGLGSTVDTETVEEGGQNLYTQRLPKKIQHENLVLERGMMLDSPMTKEFETAMSEFRFKPANVLVSLLGPDKEPISNWLFMKAYPVKWSISDLDATQNAVVIERMELAYQQFQSISL